jgi:hypothetical protein
MATFNTAFGSLPGYNEMLGTTNTTGGGQQGVYGQRAQQQRTTTQTPGAMQPPAPAKTFAQLQKEGMARPAPPTKPLEATQLDKYGGSQQASTMRTALADQLKAFGDAPSRFDTKAFQQIRGAQAANLQSEFTEQQRQLNEDLARRGLSASSIAGSGLARLGGAQSRALADLDAQLLQRAAETQAQDRAQLLQSGQSFAELAGAQDLAEYETGRQTELADFENALRLEQFREQQYRAGGDEAFRAAQAEESAQQAARQFDLAAMGQTGQLSLELQRLLGQQQIAEAELTGTLGAGAAAPQTLQARQTATQERQLAFQNAQRLSEQSGVQYTVDATGNVVVLRDAAGNPVRTSADTRAAEALKLQEAGVTGLYGTGTAQALTQDALQNAYARAAQLSQITGQQYDVNPQTGAITLKTGTGGAAVGTLAAELQRAGLTGTLGGQSTLDRLQQNLQNAQIMSQITGRQYTVDTNGALVVAGAGAAQTEAARQADLDMQLRRQLGLTEASGYIYDMVSGNLTRTTAETVQGQIARSQTLLALANALKDLDPTQLANLLGRGQTTTQSSGTPTTQNTNQTTTTRDTGVTTTTTPSERVGSPPANPVEGQVWTDGAGRTFRFTGGTWVLQPTTTTTGSNTTTTRSNTTTTQTPTTTTQAPTPTTQTPTTTTQGTGTLQEFPAAYTSSLPTGRFSGQYQQTNFGWAVFQNGKWYLANSAPPTTNTTIPGTSQSVQAYPGASYFSNGQYHVWNGSSWDSRATF